MTILFLMLFLNVKPVENKQHDILKNFYVLKYITSNDKYYQEEKQAWKNKLEEDHKKFIYHEGPACHVCNEKRKSNIKTLLWINGH